MKKMKLVFSFVFVICITTVNLASSEISDLGDRLYSYLASLSVNKRPQDSSEKSYNNADNDVGAEDANDELRKKHVVTERSRDQSKSKFGIENILAQWSRDKEDNEPKSRKPKIMKLTLQAKDNFEPFVRDSDNNDDFTIQKRYFHMDPVLNMRRSYTFDDGLTSSSSLELREWKEEFKDMWLKKKFEALNGSRPAGDTVNMVGARPWGVPCGDPNQHDMPWGSCMLAAECEPELRVYRGDQICGRTSFVCCGIQTHTYDNYQGFDVSFDGKSLSTETEERKEKSQKTKNDKAKKDRRKRRDARNKRLNKIRKNIKRITKEVKKILNDQYRNATKHRKKRTKQISSFVKELKKQYKKDRKAANDLNEFMAIKIDSALDSKLKQLKATNHEFVDNKTFRDIIVNGTVSRVGARMLIEAYPELIEFTALRQHGLGAATRRMDANSDVHLEYDLEYGYLYS